MPLVAREGASRPRGAGRKASAQSGLRIRANPLLPRAAEASQPEFRRPQTVECAAGPSR